MIVALLLLFTILQIADGLTTVHILKNGYEANPVMRWIFGKIGTEAGLIAVKSALILLVFCAWNEALLFWINVLYIGVVGWNTYQIFKRT